MELLNFDENPVFNKVPGAISVGLPIKNNSITILAKESANEANDSSLRPPIRNEKKKMRLNLETNETKNFTTSELQRLVLLEQLKLTRMQIEKESISKIDKIQNRKTENCNGTSPEIQLFENLDGELREFINL